MEQQQHIVIRSFDFDATRKNGDVESTLTDETVKLAASRASGATPPDGWESQKAVNPVLVVPRDEDEGPLVGLSFVGKERDGKERVQVVLGGVAEMASVMSSLLMSTSLMGAQKLARTGELGAVVHGMSRVFRARRIRRGRRSIEVAKIAAEEAARVFDALLTGRFHQRLGGVFGDPEDIEVRQSTRGAWTARCGDVFVTVSGGSAEQAYRAAIAASAALGHLS